MRVFYLLAVAIGCLIFTPLEAQAQSFRFGNNSGAWAHDGECDDPRFQGAGMGQPDADHEFTDASDCSDAYYDGTIELSSVTQYIDDDDIWFGDNSSQWAFDDECDDPRFYGQGMADAQSEEDEYHDAYDCETAYEVGTIFLF